MAIRHSGLKVFLLIVMPLIPGVVLVVLGLFVLDNKDLRIGAAIIGAVSTIVGLVFWRLYTKRCKECGLWNALVVTEREEVDRVATAIKKTLREEHRNSKGEVTKTVQREVMVPGVKVTYLVTTQCKYCKNVDQHHETRKYET